MESQYQPLCQRLRQHFDQGVTRPLEWRRQQLTALRRLITENEPALLAALHQDLAKPAMEAWSTELAYVTGDIDHSLKRLKRWSAPRKATTPIVAQPGQAWVQPEPLGLVLIIGTWNYPLQICLAPLVAALSAGNCAILKPSELAPATAAILTELLPQYLDNEAVAVVNGAVAETTELLTERFDHILYTGNGAVGRIVMSAAAKHLTPVTLELGGKSPVFVDDSADLTITAQRLAWGKWLNAGQTCIAPDYVMVTAKQAGALMDALASAVHQMYGGEPKSSDSYGRIINERHCQRLITYLDGHEGVIGGEHDLAQRYLAPTIVQTDDWGCALMQEEIFGPILPVLVVKDFDEAVSRVRQGEKPLAAYLFSKDGEQQRRWVEQVSAGNQCLNDVLMFSAVPDLPFGGVGASGMGRYSGQAGFDTFSHLKAVLKRGWLKDLPLRFAPYSADKFKWLKRVR
ncbi:aldehyde dehydrogenase family protein [Ferrimonas marina]|uniref:Aldehyde dehydrogenase n=1 Tax=Ferrimonas marina TaxID=299255 RepID=A0A1M5MJ41_9GAMM|nr:aldehyde dehydrogenase family protein [Ferrimonas marina]SHG77227.1 aldehyde dehydrogenase (NAD+) [Ferrimonas marina]